MPPSEAWALRPPEVQGGVAGVVALLTDPHCSLTDLLGELGRPGPGGHLWGPARVGRWGWVATSVVPRATPKALWPPELSLQRSCAPLCGPLPHSFLVDGGLGLLWSLLAAGLPLD